MAYRENVKSISVPTFVIWLKGALACNYSRWQRNE